MHTIKQLRRKKNISQTDLAKEIGVSLRTLQLYEKKNANIPIKNLGKIASFFGMTIAELYIHEVNESEETYLKRAPFTHFGNLCYPLEHGKYLIKAPLLLIEDQEDYSQRLGAKKETLPMATIGFVMDSLEEAHHKAFEITGNSMNDGSMEAIPNKAIVLGRKYGVNELKTDWDNGAHPIMVLVCTDRIICKRVTGINIKTNSLECQNLNRSPEYQDFKLLLEEILETYLVVKKQL